MERIRKENVYKQTRGDSWETFPGTFDHVGVLSINDVLSSHSAGVNMYKSWIHNVVMAFMKM